MIAAAYTAAEVLLFIAAISSSITGILVVVQRKTLRQVEQQGNSRDLESKRVFAMVSRRLADENSKWEQAAKDAEKVYKAALISAANKVT